jgi:glycogen(starch) synthase
MLSWEYPPLVVGGISAHVEGLAQAMARAGHDVVVLSLHHPAVPDDATVNGVRVLRARTDLPWIPEQDLVARMASANHQLVQLAAQLGSWRPDVVHAHDWLVAWAGDTLKALWGVPLVATIHATERGRHGGHVPPGPPAAINAAEWWLTYQAREVICCSRFMAREVLEGFELPMEKLHLVPNGVDPALWAPPTGAAATPREPLVLSWGRVQYEKGFQVLAGAMALLRHKVPGIRCIIAGRGSYLPELQMQIDVEGVSDLVHLAGFVPDDDLRTLLRPRGHGRGRADDRGPHRRTGRDRGGHRRRPAVRTRLAGPARHPDRTGPQRAGGGGRARGERGDAVARALLVGRDRRVHPRRVPAGHRLTPTSRVGPGHVRATRSRAGHQVTCGPPGHHQMTMGDASVPPSIGPGQRLP